MASVDSQLIEEVTAHAQSDSFEDAREICAGGTYFPNNLRIFINLYMFRATMCPSSGETTVFLRHLVIGLCRV